MKVNKKREKFKLQKFMVKKYHNGHYWNTHNIHNLVEYLYPAALQSCLVPFKEKFL